MANGETPRLDSLLESCVSIDGDGLTILDESAFRSRCMDQLARLAAFGGPTERETAAWVIRRGAAQLGVISSSLHSLYRAVGSGEPFPATVPAINVRGMAYDMGRALFRAANRTRCQAFIAEISRTELRFGGQSPQEFSAVLLAAAVREGYCGPVFLQGDHYQISLSAYGADPEAELSALRDLIRESVEAGFFNVDVDCSTLVDLSKSTIPEQQLLNARHTAELIAYARQLEPEGITLCLGAEIGEVGGKNSISEELRGFLDQCLPMLPAGVEGPSKISVQTGTVHGGVLLADGSIAPVQLDLGTLRELSSIARKEYGLGGAVQHGASTLPDEAFDRFPQSDAIEVHLAQGFQNIILDSPYFPSGLRDQIYSHLATRYGAERSGYGTDQQFYYNTRKRAWGTFKEQAWGLPEEVRVSIGQLLEDRFVALFQKLAVVGSASTVEKFVKPVPVTLKRPRAVGVQQPFVSCTRVDNACIS